MTVQRVAETDHAPELVPCDLLLVEAAVIHCVAWYDSAESSYRV